MRKINGYRVRRLTLQTPNNVVMDGDENTIIGVFSKMLAGIAIAALVMAIMILAGREASGEGSLESSVAKAGWFQSNE